MSVVNKEVIDRLTPWLLSNLHSDDLDAKDMSDYVISLISAPGTQEQLYARCKSELEEFLGPQTESFVNALFQQITRLTQGEQASEQETQEQQGPPQGSQALSGGQEEFRRNFRGDFQPFSPQSQHQQPHHHHNNNQNQQQHQQQQHNQQMPPPGFGGFPGMPPPQGMPPQGFPGFPPAGFPPNGMMPPQFGFQGFGRGGKFNNQHRNNGGFQKKPQRKLHSPISSIQNEHSVANRRLVVEQIPPEHLNKESIEQFFGKFGKLTDIKINEQQNLADIEFEGHDQAVEAHKSPEPIFGNRFVKVFWRKHSGDHVPELDVEAVRRMQAIKQQQFEEKEAKRKELTANLRNVMNEQASILQQRQQMLQSGQTDPAAQAEMQRKSEELSAKLKELKQELSSLQGSATAGPTRGGFRGRGGANPYSRGARAPRGSYRGGFVGSFGGASKFKNASIDRRPKAVLLEGVAGDKDEVLRSELASRNYTDYQRKSENAVVVEFADRRTAEEFFNFEVPELGSVKKSWIATENRETTPSAAADVAMGES